MVRRTSKLAVCRSTTLLLVARLLFVSLALGAFAGCGDETQTTAPPKQGGAETAAPGGASGGALPGTPHTPSAAGLDTEWWRRTPAARLLLTGGQRGTLRPCGCTSPPTGGLERMASVLHRLREAGRVGKTVVAALSVGWSLGSELEPQDEAMADYLRGVRAALGYSAALLGAPDLRVPAMCQPRGPGPETPTPPLNVKLADAHPASSATRYYADFTIGRVGVRALSIVDPGQAEALADEGIADAVSSASQQLGGLRPNADVVWLVATRVRSEGAVREIRSGLKRLGAGIVVDVVGSGHGQRTVDGFALKPGGEALVVELEDRGTAVGVLDFDRAEDGVGWTVSYRQIELVPQWEKYGGPAIEAVQQLAGLYRAMVRERGYMLALPRARERGPSYVGSSACASCHRAIYNDWKRTPHALALETLQAQEYHWDPQCIRCHVVGWERTDPQRWTVWRSGFRDPDRTPYLGGVGCESCHGPGSAHAADPASEPVSSPSEPGQATCLRCHDAENSHRFRERFKGEYLPAVNHHRVPADLKTVVPQAPGGGKAAKRGK